MIGHASSVNIVALSSDDGTIISGSNNGTVLIWDEYQGTIKHFYRFLHTEKAESVSFFSSGSRDDNAHNYFVLDKSSDKILFYGK